MLAHGRVFNVIAPLHYLKKILSDYLTILKFLYFLKKYTSVDLFFGQVQLISLSKTWLSS